MAISRAGNPELYDSFFEGGHAPAPVPSSEGRRRPPPLPARAVVALAPASTRGDDETVAVAVQAGLAGFVSEALQRAGLLVGSREMVGTARVVVVDAELSTASSAVAGIRVEARADAAVIVLLSGERGSSAASVAMRDAARAGAFGCLHVPLIAEELQALVAAAVDVGVAKAQVARLSKKLDVDAELASIGRISAGLTHEIANPLGIAATNLDAVAAETDHMFALLQDLVRAPFAELPLRLREMEKEIANARGPDGVLTAIHDSKIALRRIGSLLGTMRDLVGGVGNARHDTIDLLAVANEIAQRWIANERAGVQVSVVGSPVVVPADEVLVMQILQNLTANAIHAVQSRTDAHVRLHVYCAEGAAIVSVRDNGPGIPTELHERVFEPFYTTRRGNGGTGLGLALCREYAVRMGADLSLWSAEGRGTCFRLTIPLPAASEA